MYMAANFCVDAANDAPLLTLRGFGVAFGPRIVLNDVDFEITGPGVHVVMGPSGTGKSTLLRTLCRINFAVPSFRSWGEASYLGAELGSGNSPGLVGQNARLLMSSLLENVISELPHRGELTHLGKHDAARAMLIDGGLEWLQDDLDRQVVDLPLAVQRHVAIIRAAGSGAPLLCIDEPTADLDDLGRRSLLSFLKKLGQSRAVLVVTHNQRDALELEGSVTLLAGGSIQGRGAAQTFFQAPPTPVATDFVRTGSCSLPSPNAMPEEVDESMRPYVLGIRKAAHTYVPGAQGPRGFLWLKKGLLAGTPRPGIIQDLDYDLKALKRVGITTLVSLTTTPVDQADLERFGIKGIWMPIIDMCAPGLEEALAMCRTVDRLMKDGEAVAYHCRAGLGRTGTMLASQLIFEGVPALEALEKIRRIERGWVQSEAQVIFLQNFCNYMPAFKVT